MNISMVTLGVGDLERSKRFYEALGWELSEMSNDNVGFLKGADVVLGLFGHEALAEDAGVVHAEPSFRGVACAINRETKEDVDAFVERAREAGATVTKVPQDVFWGGYSGYFTDPDGHLWEVGWNPFIRIDANGRMQL